MQAHIVNGRIAGIPYSKNVVDINSSNVTQVIDAATGLVRAVSNVALNGAGIVAGTVIIATILRALMSGLQASTKGLPISPVSPPLPLGCAPVWIEVPDSRFWGVILTQELRFVTSGNCRTILSVEFAKISSLKSRKNDGGIELNLVDGSEYKNIIPIEKRLEIATLGGKQFVKLHSYWNGSLEANFKPSTAVDVSTLKGNLQLALTNNGAAITQLLGTNILQTYFYVPKIGP